MTSEPATEEESDMLDEMWTGKLERGESDGRCLILIPTSPIDLGTLRNHHTRYARSTSNLDLPLGNGDSSQTSKLLIRNTNLFARIGVVDLNLASHVAPGHFYSARHGLHSNECASEFESTTIGANGQVLEDGVSSQTQSFHLHNPDGYSDGCTR